MAAKDLFKGEDVIRLANAVASGDTDEIKRHLDSGSDPNSMGADGISLLIWAVGAKSLDGIKELIAAGANPNYQAPNGISAVSLAAGAEDSKLLKQLLMLGGDPNIKQNNKSALHIAVEQFRFENVKLLIESGADVNSTDSTNSTAAEVAAGFGRYDIAVYILEHGLEQGLIDLAKVTEFRTVGKGSEQDLWRDKAFQILKSKGINFPIMKKNK